MRSFNSSELLQTLITDVCQIIDKANSLLALDNVAFNKTPDTGGWSVAQVLAHLNYYNSVYIPPIEKALESKKSYNEKIINSFKPGFLGNYFTKMMQPGANNTIAKKMSAPAASRPTLKAYDKQMICLFIANQEKLIYLLKSCNGNDLSAIKIPTSIISWLKLYLGDTFRFLIAHQQRHFVQISNVLRQTERENLEIHN